MNTPNSWNLKIFYDGACPICSKEISFLKRRDKKNKLNFEDTAVANFDRSIFPVFKNSDTVIHGMLPDGKFIHGLEVFRNAYREIGFGWLLAPTGWPILKPIFDSLYLIFAKNRLKISRLFGRNCDKSCS